MSALDEVLDRPRGQKIALLAVALAVVVLVDRRFIYGPLAERTRALSAEVRARREEVEKKARTAGQANVAHRAVRSLLAKLRQARARLPNEKEIPDLLDAISASARQAGLEIVLFRQKGEEYRKYYAEVPVEMRMRGTFGQLARFFDRVRQLDRIINVSDISLTKPELRGDQVVLDASCTATTFRFLDEAERARIARERRKKKHAAKAGRR